MITYEDRKLIRKKLPQGSGKKISEMSGISMVSVSRWMTGKTNSLKIENAAIELLIKLNKDRDRTLKKIGLL